MTPLQIVQAIRDADNGLYRLLPSEAVDLILGVENDTLERAAHRAEAFDQNVADAIREMKHLK